VVWCLPEKKKRRRCCVALDPSAIVWLGTTEKHEVQCQMHETVSKAHKLAASNRVKVGSGAAAVEDRMSSIFLSTKSRKISEVNEGPPAFFCSLNTQYSVLTDLQRRRLSVQAFSISVFHFQYPVALVRAVLRDSFKAARHVF